MRGPRGELSSWPAPVKHIRKPYVELHVCSPSVIYKRTAQQRNQEEKSKIRNSMQHPLIFGGAHVEKLSRSGPAAAIGSSGWFAILVIMPFVAFSPFTIGDLRLL